MNQELTIQEIQNFKGQYPKQLWALFFSEMWERFCFYGNRGMLTVFMVSQMAMPEKDANLKYGAIQAFVYAFTFVGGLFADKILGFRKSLFWGGLLMIVGSFLLGFSPINLYYIGICFIIIGTGFFKPNISSMVGSLYAEGDSRRDAGFSLFYMGINIGALLGGLVCVWVGKYHSWHLAFALSGIFMLVGLIVFIINQKNLGPIGISPMLHLPEKTQKLREYAVYAISILILPLIYLLIQNSTYTDYFMYSVGIIALIYYAFEMSKLNSEQNKKMIAAFIFIIFSVVFWAFFEQSGGSLSLFALNNLQSFQLGFLNIDPNVVNNTSNSLFVILFAAPLGLLWVWLSKRNAEPNTVVKFGLGFLFLAGAFYVFYACRFFADSNGISSLGMFTLAYLVITFGELCLSPIGLSIMTKLSPKHLAGMMMGMWFLASAYGQYIAGLLGAEMSLDKNASNMDKLTAYTDGYYQLAIYALIAGVILIVISPMVRKLMGEVK